MSKFFQEHGEHFLVGGVPYEEFLINQVRREMSQNIARIVLLILFLQVEEHRLQQEHERLSKIQEKKEKNIHETIYGSKAATPAKLAGRGTKRAAGGAVGTPMAAESKRGRPDLTAVSSAHSMARSPFAPRNNRKPLTATGNKSRVRKIQ